MFCNGKVQWSPSTGNLHGITNNKCEPIWTTISKPFAKPFGWTKPTGSWYRSITLLLFTSWCEEMTAKIGMWTATSATLLWSTKTWLFTSSANVPPDSISEPFSFLILPITRCSSFWVGNAIPIYPPIYSRQSSTISHICPSLQPDRDYPQFKMSPVNLHLQYFPVTPSLSIAYRCNPLVAGTRIPITAYPCHAPLHLVVRDLLNFCRSSSWLLTCTFKGDQISAKAVEGSDIEISHVQWSLHILYSNVQLRTYSGTHTNICHVTSRHVTSRPVMSCV